MTHEGCLWGSVWKNPLLPLLVQILNSDEMVVGSKHLMMGPNIVFGQPEEIVSL
jgi:hypothetical protein